MSESHKESEFKKYKFKELKVYASTEWLADNMKKYRQVFDRFNTSYIYAELSFHNKYFDIETWEVNVKLKCFKISGKKKEVCSLELKKKVSKYDHIVYIREGWGNKKEGAFWKSGTYYWEAYIEGQLVATKYFYIEDVGLNYMDDGTNPYVDIKSLKLYEGQFDDVIEEERQYYEVFSYNNTRYIHTELTLENLNKAHNWHCELFIKYYNGARELKGQINRLINVEKGQETIRTTAGWGSNTPASWRQGMYSVEVVFMEQLLASVDFEVDDEFIEGIPELKLPYGRVEQQRELEYEKETFEEVIHKLDQLIGLSNIKTKVKEHAQYLKFINLRREKGFDEKEQINIHCVFQGNPGTGKTTVAKMMGRLYHKMGLLSKGHVMEVDRVDLVGEYIGQTAPKVKEVIEKARGGVLFIDEAYSLARSPEDNKDFGREVIEILVKEMSNGKGDLAVIVAGYPKEMKNFIDSNPGLKSRFKHFFTFEDYLPQELIAIAEYAAKEKEVTFSPQAQALLEEIITDEYRKRDRSFGNARFVYDLIDRAKINLGLRIMKRKNPMSLSVSDLSQIDRRDMYKLSEYYQPEKPRIPIDEKLLKLAIDELNGLIGIEKIKVQIKELVDIIRYHREAGKHVVNAYSFHTVFVGNPGTGKTTVARILTKIYKALGILDRGHMVETDRQGLIAGFVGQTAIKTAERIDEAMGGVLFIDEAYSLSNFNGLQGDYGNEAIQTILKRMEDDRGSFFVFVAGYPDNMDKFLKANPGLSSRFDQTLVFEDYSKEELVDIAIKMIRDQSMRINKKAQTALGQILGTIHEYRDKYFGNARTVRKIILELIKLQNLRYASLPPEKRTSRMNNLITFEDVQTLDISAEKTSFNQEGIGFK